MSRAPDSVVPGAPFHRSRIYGAGRMGLSVAGAMRARSVSEIIELVDPDPESRARAVGLEFPAEPRAALFPSPPDLVILAATPRAIEQLLPQVLRDHPSALVTDVAVVKRPLAAIATALAEDALRYVGSHPVLEGAIGGVLDTGLFVGAPVAICPLPETPNAIVASMERLWQLLGARTVLMSAAEHDRSLAVTGHLPLITAGALARLGQPALRPGSAGTHLISSAFRDTTRVAASEPQLWSEILERNADHIAPRLRELAADLSALAGHLEGTNEEAAPGERAPQEEVAAWLETASRFRHRLEGE